MVCNRETAYRNSHVRLQFYGGNVQIYLEVNILIAKEIISFLKFQVFIYVLKENIICL